jgi:hypothetical protein
VDIPDLTLSLKSGGNYVVPSCTLDFDEPLLPNTNYTLVVDLREVPYARSNIYWDGNQLTFDRTNKGNEDYQGVFFKWGSLVGIPPDAIANGTYVPLYIPANISSRTWDDTKTIASAFGDWAGIPSGSMSDDFSNYKGDICKYIDSDWKMPDLRVADQYYNEDGFEARTFAGASYDYDPVHDFGRAHMGDAGVFHSLYGTFLPVTGYRDANGATREVAIRGHYWKNDGGRLYFGSGFIYSMSATSGEAYAVRCIKADF